MLCPGMFLDKFLIILSSNGGAEFADMEVDQAVNRVQYGHVSYVTHVLF